MLSMIRSCAVRRCLHAAALVEDGLGVEERLLRAPVGGVAEDLLAHGDHHHEDQLDQAGDEEQELERVLVELEHVRLASPTQVSWKTTAA